MEQGVQQADDPVVVQPEPRHAALANDGRFGQCRQEAAVDGSGQEVGLQGEGAVIIGEI
jgi:hypothetical protein